MGLETPRMEKLKQFIAEYANVHTPSAKDKNVIIISTPRSGSTWLMELIATQPGFKKIREPFNFRKEPVAKHLGITSWDKLYDPASFLGIESYLTGFLDGSLKFKNTKPWKRQYRPFTNRLVFKILHGFEHRIDDLSRILNAEVVMLFRHPIPVSLSRKEYPRIDTFLTSEYRNQFSPEQLAYAREINEKGKKLERGMLSWCLQNCVPLKDKKAHWALVTYEQLVMAPEVVTDYLCGKFRFRYRDKMLQRLNIASGSINQSTDETRQKIQKGDKRWLIEKWRKKVDAETEKRLMKIPGIFGIDMYIEGKYMAADKYLI